MNVTPPVQAPPQRRVLAVADWAVDPHAVVAAASARAPATFWLAVPAWLHGLDWAGDPRASRPCARRQLERLLALFRDAGLEVTGGSVGEPEPVTSIGDALAAWPADEILLCTRPRRLRHPLDLAHRARRSTGLRVDRVAAPAAERTRRGGHCRVGAS